MPLYGLIGYPLGHSFSQAYFNKKFQTLGLAGSYYVNFPLVDIGELPVVVKANPGLAGLNVTMPHKEGVIRFLDEQDEVVRACGACNCIRFRDGKLHGFNTDVIGFERSWESLLKPHHTHALVLGTGGSSKAVAYVLKQRGIVFSFVSRTARPDENIIGYESLTEALMRSHTLLINTTPLGMAPKVAEAPPIPYQHLSAAHYCYDLVYNPAETLFLRKSKEQGATIKNGHDMLELQAEAGWEIWNS